MAAELTSLVDRELVRVLDLLMLRKELDGSVTVDELHEVWPEARFVVLVRDGRDVALSVRRVPFGANNAWAAAHTWAHGIRLVRAAERK